VDWQRVLDVDVSGRKRGDPMGFIVQHATLILDSSPLASGIPAELRVSYFRTPDDLILLTDTPEIEKRWRLYLIPLTLYWGKILTEKSADAISTIAFWEKKKTATIDKVTNTVHATENKILRLDPSASGTEDADELY